MRSLANFLSPKASKTPANRFQSTTSPAVVNNKKDENYNIDVLCTNCQGMINVNEIDKHSMICCKVSEKVFQIENNLNVDQIEYKLSKLKEALESHINQRRNFADARNEEAQAREIIGYISQILNFDRRSDLKKIKLLKDLLSIIQTKLEVFKGSTSLLLYLERVKLLGKEKYRELIKQDQESISNWKEQINFGATSSSNNHTNSTSSSMNSGHNRNLMIEVNSSNIPIGQGLRSPGIVPHTTKYSANPFSQGTDRQQVSESPSFPAGNLMNNLNSANLPRFGQNSIQTPSKARESSLVQTRTSETARPVPVQRLLSPQNRISSDFNQKPPSYPNSQYPSNAPFQPFDISRKSNQGTTMPFQINASPNMNQSRSTANLSGSRQPNNAFSPTQRYINQSPDPNDFQARLNDSDNQQPRASQGIMKQHLETRLESTKKEYSQVTQLVDTYKRKTESIQNSMNMANYGTTNPRNISSNPSLRDSIASFDSNPRRSQKNTYREGSESPDQMRDRGYGHDNNFIKLKHNMIEEIDSDYERRGLSSKYSETQETTSNIERSISKGPRPQEDFGFEDIDQNYELQAMQDAAQEEQRLFYSKCLAIKLKFRTQDLAQRVPVALVYKDAIQRGVPERDWDAFIENAFRHPEGYIDLKKIQKKRKHGLKNNLAEIAKTKVIPKRNRDNFHNIDVIYE